MHFCQSIVKVVGGKGISETKSKQQSPCSNCMHRPVMSWGNACSTCMHCPVMCMHPPVRSQANALTAWDLKFQVCLGYTFTPATLKHYCLAHTGMENRRDKAEAVFTRAIMQYSIVPVGSYSAGDL
jgi:hypothetical protein